MLTGKYRTGIPADSRGASSRLRAVRRQCTSTRAASQIVEAVGPAAEGLDLTPVEVALAWVRDQPGVAAPDRRRAHGRAAAGLPQRREDHTLPDEILDALDDVSAPRLGYPET